jgi:2-desacetyl-2-hydroxyethyl bacteriochlorophyllide A dehydrogenase
LGHELAVEIVELGEKHNPADLKVGDIASVNPYMNCGTCIACRRGRPNACVRMQVLGVHQDGGMREYLVLPVQKLHRTRDLSLEAVALVEMFSIGAHAVRRANLQAGDVVLVIGAGPIGLATMQFAKLKGAEIIAMDVNPSRLAFCHNVLEIPHTIDARNEPQEALKQLLGDDLPTTVFDATGSARSMNAAFQYVAHGGQLVFIGITKDSITFSDPHFHSHEITLLASRNATKQDFARVIEFLNSGGIQVESWITHHTTPEHIVDEFFGWFDPNAGVLKAMLSF